MCGEVGDERVQRRLLVQLLGGEGRTGKACSPQDLTQHRIQPAQARCVARAAAVVIILRAVGTLFMHRSLMCGMPDRVREPHLLREQQQRTHEL